MGKAFKTEKTRLTENRTGGLDRQQFRYFMLFSVFRYPVFSLCREPSGLYQLLQDHLATREELTGRSAMKHRIYPSASSIEILHLPQ